jgi:hypothetical protein
MCILALEFTKLAELMETKGNKILRNIKTRWISIISLVVMILVLSLRPKQGHGKVQVESATQESHSHSRECERV